jgi:hypothetical protein
MNRLGELLGSVTRGNIIEALALSAGPLTAYRVARTYNMNVAKVYSEMKRLNSLGMVKPAERGRAGVEYELVDEDLRNLALKLTSRVQTYESWKSDDSRRARFRMGLASVPHVPLERGARAVEQGQRRLPGELENLAALGRKKFDSKYRKTAVRAYGRV